MKERRKSIAWKRLLGGAVLTYVVVTGVLLNTHPLRDKINSWNDGHIDYALGLSIVPGLVHLKGFELRHQDRNVEWTARIPWVSVWINPFPLLEQRFSAWWVSGWGVKWGFRLRAGGTPSPAEGRMYPHFAGIPNKNPDSPRDPTRKKWSVSVTGINLNDVKELWFDRFRFEGSASIRGKFRIDAGKEVEVGPASLSIGRGEVLIGTRAIASDFRLVTEMRLRPFDPEGDALNDFSVLDAKLDVAAEMAALDFLAYYFRELEWIGSREGSGSVDARVFVRGGEFQSDSVLTARSDKLRLRLFGADLSSAAAVAWRVDGAGKRSRLELVLSDFTLRGERAREITLEGKRLICELESRRLQIDSLFAEPVVRLRTSGARVPSLRHLNAYLPKYSAFRFEGGRAKLTADIRAGGGARDRGELTLEAPEARATYHELHLLGDLRLSARLDAGNFETRRFRVSGTELRLNGVSTSEGKNKKESEGVTGWWSTLAIPRGTLTLSSPMRFRGDLRATLRDARPLLALYRQDGDPPGIVSSMLDRQRLRATATISIDGQSTELSGAMVEGDGLELRGRLRVLPWETWGVLLVRYGPLAFGLETWGEESNLVLHDAAGWYAKQPRFETRAAE